MKAWKEGKGLRVLADNPTLKKLRYELSGEKAREEAREKAVKIREKLDAPALDLRSKYDLPEVKTNGVQSEK